MSLVRSLAFLIASFCLVAHADVDDGWEATGSLAGIAGSTYVRFGIAGGSSPSPSWAARRAPSLASCRADPPFLYQTGRYRTNGCGSMPGPTLVFSNDAGEDLDAYLVAGVRRDAFGRFAALELMHVGSDNTRLTLLRAGL